MDCIMLSFERKSMEQLLSKKEQIQTLLKVLPSQDAEFDDAITLATSDTKRLEYPS